MRLPRDAELGVARREAVPAGRAVIPGPRQGDRAEHRVDDLVPVGDEVPLRAPGRTGHAVPGARGRRPATAPARSPPSRSSRPGSPPPLPPSRRRRSPGPWPPRRPAVLARRPSRPRGRAASPLFPSRLGRGITAGFARHRRAGLADRLIHLRHLAHQAPEPLILRDFPLGPFQFRPRLQVHRPRPPLPPSASGSTADRDRDGPGRRTRSAACRTYGAPRSATPGGSPRPGPAAVKLLAPALESRQLISILRHAAS